MPRLIERAFLSYAVGAVVGAGALLLESAASGTRPSAEALAGYTIVGGLFASAIRLSFALLLPSRVGQTGAVAVLAAFGSLHLLYFANVYLLPGEHYLGARSLATDALIVLAVGIPAVWMTRSARAEAARRRWGVGAAGLGAALLVLGLGVLAVYFPRDEGEVSRTGTGPNLLLVVLDSVRRDHMGFHGYAAAVSPELDREAAKARVFDAAFSASSWTVPSVARLLQVDETTGVAGPALTLPERLVHRGFVTACFTDNPHLGSGSSLLRGFDRVDRSVGTWRDIFRGTVIGLVIERVSPGRDADLVDRASEWAGRQRGPFFLYVHLMDSHAPFRQAPIDGRRRPGRRVEFPVSGMTMSASEAEDVVARYDGGVQSADAQAGRLLAAARRWSAPFLAVVTADHGESLGEAGHWSHGQTLRPELLAIPLLLTGDSVVPGRVATPVGYGALTATLLAAAGDPEPQGADLRTQAGNGIVEGALPPSLRYRIVGGHKLVVDTETGRRQLFDLVRDPREEIDRSRESPELAATLAEGLSITAPASLSAESRERLRALGYASW
jgi:arylsulfatase A-like enzyme